MNKTDWLILNTLSDDVESMTQLYPIKEGSQVSRTGLIDRIEILIQEGLIKLDHDVAFDKEALLAEPEVYYDTEFWFGLTGKGAEAWEKNAQEFGGFEVDWSENWTANFDYEKQEGYIFGVSEEICMKRLKAEREAVIDFSSLQVKPVSNYWAKYYKNLPGGVKIEFTLKKKQA